MGFRIFFIMLFYYLSFYQCNAQPKYIKLDEVEVIEKSLPIIEIEGKEYSFKERDFLVKRVLKYWFRPKIFYMKLDLLEFTDKRKFCYEIEGNVKVFIDGSKISKKNKYKSLKAIQYLNSRIKHISIQKEKNETIIKIKT
ncbi:MAG: hypothetical protein P8J67_02005 [Flavobacteriaceae bacterium]|nr:hypothetical protein [Flavobacteriaceae bacterium]MDG2062330.1 hypothetical protein [Flavobacteriaceae bacterium]|tara:strand:- start:338 stop:757 length:420 start_codon:yes stop_codon:yes gene_type:complete